MTDTKNEYIKILLGVIFGTEFQVTFTFFFMLTTFSETFATNVFLR